MGLPRQEYSRGLPFPSPGDLLHPGTELGSLALQADFLLLDPPGTQKTPRKSDSTPASCAKWNPKATTLWHVGRSEHHCFSVCFLTESTALRAEPYMVQNWMPTKLRKSRVNPQGLTRPPKHTLSSPKIRILAHKPPSAPQSHLRMEVEARSESTVSHLGPCRG